MEELKVKFLMGPPDCNDPHIPEYSENYLKELGKVLGMPVVCRKSEEVKNQALSVYFIASGGAEPGFKEVYKQVEEPYILLTTPAYNSLAAAMEIMGFLQEQGLEGEILHGSYEEISKRLHILLRTANAKKKLNGMRLGCFGEPGGLIASNVEFQMFQSATGAIMEMYDLNELIDEYRDGGYIENKYTQQLLEKGYNLEETEKALNVYGALKRLIKKYDLNAVTVRCFDLLKAVHTTGCLALAILNAEGIPAACEGDQKSLISMVILNALTGESGFMANPSCMDPKKKEIIFAHCTLPIDMPDDYNLTTHFESGVGVAVAGNLESQEMTIFKCDETMKRYYAGRATLLETMHRKDLCRTQMKLYLEDGTEYFAKSPISNHHIICKGDWKEVIDQFFEQM